MAHRKHLFSLRIAHAVRESYLLTGLSKSLILKDAMAGVSIGIIAIPLSMALAVASGVAPQYGLYSAIAAGFLIPLLGGSRYSVSGPTAAFVVILLPIVKVYGLAGLLTASVLAGFIQICLAKLRFGRFIEYIPESVTLGFTLGIAVVIAVLQLKDFLGIPLLDMPNHFHLQISALIEGLPSHSTSTLLVGFVTLSVMIIWPRLGTKMPPHLPSMLVGSVMAYFFNSHQMPVATIGSSFEYLGADGEMLSGIPSQLPSFEWPWQRTQSGETPLLFSVQTVEDLLPAAFAIAMLGAIESLLCAVVLDGMSSTKHSANSELLGQGIGNVVAPFFGGITATAAIARSAANLNAGAQSPLSAMIHALVVLMALLVLSSVLVYMPMASMAAMLLVVAWNMSDAPKAIHLLKTAPNSDIAVFLICFSLTVFIDMVVAIGAGVVMASLLFTKSMADMTRISDVTSRYLGDATEWKVIKISGPLFFAAADRVFGELAFNFKNQKGVVLYLDAVNVLDGGGYASFLKYLNDSEQHNRSVYIADVQSQPNKTLAKAGFKPSSQNVQLFSSLKDAIDAVKEVA